jgi:hypothetical protein
LNVWVTLKVVLNDVLSRERRRMIEAGIVERRWAAPAADRAARKKPAG